MAFTGGGMMNLMSAAVRVGIIVNYTGDHLLSAFRTNVDKASASVLAMNSNLAKMQLIRWAVPAFAIGGVIHGLAKAVSAGEDLQVTLTQIGSITKANTESMDAYLAVLLQASSRTRFTTAEVGNLSLVMLKNMPYLQQQGESGFKQLTSIVKPAVEVASALGMLGKGSRMEPTEVVKAIGKILTVTRVAKQGTAEQTDAINLIGSALLRGPFKSPEQLTSQIGYMQGVALPLAPLDEFAYASALTARGVTGGGRGGALGGRALEEIVMLMFGKPEMGHAGGLPRQLGYFPSMTGTAPGGAAAARTQMLSHALGIDAYASSVLKDGAIDLVALFKTIHESAVRAGPARWAQYVNAFPTPLRRVLAGAIDRPISDEVEGFKKAIVDGKDRMVAFNDAMLTTARGAREQLGRNLTDLSSLIGLQLLPSLARFYTWVDSGVVALYNLIVKHQTATLLLIDFGLALTAAAAALTAFKISSAVFGMLGFGMGGAGAAAGTVAGGSVLASLIGEGTLAAAVVGYLPVIAAVVLGSALLFPIVSQVYGWVKEKIMGEAPKTPEVALVDTKMLTAEELDRYNKGAMSALELSQRQIEFTLGAKHGSLSLPDAGTVPNAGMAAGAESGTEYAFSAFAVMSPRNSNYRNGAIQRLNLPGGGGGAERGTVPDATVKAHTGLNNVATAAQNCTTAADACAVALQSVADAAPGTVQPSLFWRVLDAIQMGKPLSGEDSAALKSAGRSALNWAEEGVQSNLGWMLHPAPVASDFADTFYNLYAGIRAINQAGENVLPPAATPFVPAPPTPTPPPSAPMVLPYDDRQTWRAEPPVPKHTPVQIQLGSGADSSITGFVRTRESVIARDTPRSTSRSIARSTRTHSSMRSTTPGR